LSPTETLLKITKIEDNESVISTRLFSLLASFALCKLSFVNSSFVAGGKVGSFACFGVAMESAASKCANARWPLLCPRGIVHNVSICVRAGLPKPRGVPDTERTKDTKTLDFASTPLDANTVLAVRYLITIPNLSFKSRVKLSSA